MPANKALPSDALSGHGLPSYTVIADPGEPTPAQTTAVAQMLGREPTCGFRLCVTDAAGVPLVIQNAPFTDEGRPMPTRYWLVEPKLCRAVARLEGQGGVRQAEQAVDAQALVELHDRYARQRDALVPAGHSGPHPTGGVGGTRRGVKCLHAHLAHYLATADDVVGDWTARQLAEQNLV